jgi:hypothetical protein
LLELEELIKGNDRRANGRRRVGMRAKIILPETAEDIHCFVHEASRSGCSISFNDTHEVPDNVTLVIEHLKKPINGKIVWRKAAKLRSRIIRAGIKFIWDDADQSEQ